MRGVKPKRSAGQTAVSISVEEDLLELMDERAVALGQSRSAYLAALVRADLARRGPLELHETPPPYGKK
jgi:metal-responsive CopG/Arc/MetJ family transcriptional regulator